MNSHPPLPGVQFSLDRVPPLREDPRRLIAAAARHLRSAGFKRRKDLIANHAVGIEIYIYTNIRQFVSVRTVDNRVRVKVQSVQHAIDIIAMVTGYCAHLSTAAQLGNALREERQLVELDQLTGLLSRRGLERVWTYYRQRWYGVCVIDIDKFKSVNDTYGHAAGDDLLRRIGHAMNKIAPGLVGRLGGDEFCALIPVSNSTTHLPGALVEAVEVTPVRPEHVYGLSASMGFSSVDDEMALWDAVAVADLDMYRDKRGADPARRVVRRQHRDAPPVVAQLLEEESAWIV